MSYKRDLFIDEKGKQSQFLRENAHVKFYGGICGGGKTWHKNSKIKKNKLNRFNN